MLPGGINLPRGVSLTPSVTVTPAREARKRSADEDIGEVARPKEKTKRNYSPEKLRLSPQKTKQSKSHIIQNDKAETPKETMEAATSSGTLRQPAAKKMKLESLCATSIEGTLATLVVLGVLWARRNVLDRARNTFNEDTGLEVGEEDVAATNTAIYANEEENSGTYKKSEVKVITSNDDNYGNDDNSNKKYVEQNNDTLLDLIDVDETVSGGKIQMYDNAVLEPNNKVEEKKEAALKPTSRTILRRRTWPQTRASVLGSSCRTRAAHLNRLARVAYLHRQTRRRS